MAPRVCVGGLGLWLLPDDLHTVRQRLWNDHLHGDLNGLALPVGYVARAEIGA